VPNRLLGDRARRQLADEREWLARLQLVLERFEASAEDRSALRQSIAQLDRFFLLVVIGEFNAGKSAFINALVGDRLLEEGVTPTTTRLQVLQHGAARERRTDTGADVLSAPVALLESLEIVDTPGTNAIFREHERLTTEFVPRADLVLFVTSADRPFTESERAFLEAIRTWGKKVVVVINKIDLLERAEEREAVVRFVAEHARGVLGATPEIFPISSRVALRRKLAGSRGSAPDEPPAAMIEGDRFEDLERYIATTLDERERLRLKLLNPIGVGERLASAARRQIGERTGVLRADLQTVDDIERQLDMYRADVSREFELRLSGIDGVLHRFENRGMSFFDETLRIGRIPDLLNKARVQREFERDVVADVPQQIERQVQDLIDWMVSSELRQWQAVTDHVNRRARAHEGRLVGGDAGSFQYDRHALIETVGRAANRAVESYDRQHEAAAMAESVRAAVAGAALAQAGALGLGAAVTALATTTAADVTGIVAAGAIAVLGMFVIPSKRKHAKAQLRDRIARMRRELLSGLRQQFEREIDRSARQVMDAVAPYTRFVRAESARLADLDGQLAEIADQLDRIRRDIEHGASE
jgi:small GTP-binding protein